jgi:hypothetical protein
MEIPVLPLAIISLLIVLRLCLPNVLIVLGRSALQCGFSGGPEEVSAYWLNNVDESLYDQMLALGFQPLGVYWEQMPFTRRFHEYVFVRPGTHFYGLLYPDDQIMPRRAAFLTVFESGVIVMTKNHGGGLKLRTNDCQIEGGTEIGTTEAEPPAPEPKAENSPASSLAAALPPVLGMVCFVAARMADSTNAMEFGLVGLVTGSLIYQFMRPKKETPLIEPVENVDLETRVPLPEIFAVQQERVQQFAAAGHTLPTRFDTVAFLESEHRFYRHPVIHGQLRSAMLMLLGGKLALLLGPALLAALITGFNHPTPWLLLCLTGLIGLYLRFGMTSAGVLRVLTGGTRGEKKSEP